MALTVSDLACDRGGRPVLAGLSFRVGAGEALILRGPNGIGKTTLLRTLAGLQPAMAGRIETGGADAAYASHADGIKGQLTVAENLRFWADVHGETLTPELFEIFDLTALKDRPAASLSAGQTRRTGLARLGVTGRAILLLDEPTVSLDAASVDRFARFLVDRHLGSGGLAVIATHIDLGLDAPELDLEPFAAAPDATGGSDEVFL